MIDSIKKIWAGPFTVKLSFIFLMFVALVIFLSNPGLMLFTGGVVYSVFQVFNWMVKDE